MACFGCGGRSVIEGCHATQRGRQNKNFRQGQWVHREGAIDLAGERVLGATVVMVTTVEVSDQHTFVEHDHCGHSSWARSPTVMASA